jgi:hypothetical protein
MLRMVVTSAARRALAPVRAFSATSSASHPPPLLLWLPVVVFRPRWMQ